MNESTLAIAEGNLSSSEEAAIDIAIAQLRNSDFFGGPPFREVALNFIAQGRLFAAEQLYKKLIALADYSPNDYLQWFQPPLWFLPGRISNQIAFVLFTAYPELVKILVAQGKDADALVYASRVRSSLLDAVLQRRVRGNASLNAFRGHSLEKMQAVARELDSTLVLYSLIQFNEGDAGLGIGPYVGAIWAWVVQPNGAVTRETLPFDLLKRVGADVPEDAFSQIVTTFHSGLPRGIIDRVLRVSDDFHKEASAADQAQRLRTLHEVLITPIKKYLPTNPAARVIIVPDGELFLVPFNALLDDDMRHLIEHHTVTIAPSIYSLALLHEEHNRKQPNSSKGKRPVLVVGDPLMPSFPGKSGISGKLTQLEGARSEARAVAALFGVEPLLGRAAREDVVIARMQKARIIHFATHGLALFESLFSTGELSSSAGLDIPPGAIVLARPDRIASSKRLSGLPLNGFLTSGKIITLKLDADIVTLSACDTARGRTDQKQFSGLPNSLLAAGARSVVMTMWAIPDAPTAELMVAFYRELVSGAPKATALRRAIIAVKDRYPSVENWGAFTLIGLPN